MKRDSNVRAGGPPRANISYGPGGVTAPGLKALASVDNISGNCGGIWRQLVGTWRLLGKVGRNLGVWWGRCLWPDGYRGIPNVCWIYLVGDHIGWYWPRFRSGRCGGGKILLEQYWRLLEIFVRGPYRFRIFESGMTSVEEFDAPIELPG